MEKSWNKPLKKWKNQWDDLGGFPPTIFGFTSISPPRKFLSQRVCFPEQSPKPNRKGYIVFQSHHFSEDFAVKLREGGRWYTREIPEKDWILPAPASNWSNPSCVILSLHHFFWCKTMVMSLLYTLILSLSNILWTWLSFTNTSQKSPSQGRRKHDASLTKPGKLSSIRSICAADIPCA